MSLHDSLAELHNDPDFQDLSQTGKLHVMVQTAARDKIFQQSHPAQKALAFHKLLRGGVARGLQQVSEDTSDPRLNAVGAGLTTGGVVTGQPELALPGFAVLGAVRGGKLAGKLAKDLDVPLSKAAELSRPLSPEMNALADEYMRAPLHDPAARQAWDALIADVEKKHSELSKKIKFIPVQDDAPYKTAREMFEDLDKGVMKVSDLHHEHPLWTREQNLKFRAVHDYHHMKAQGGFTVPGEYSAYKAQLAKTPKEARPALKAEVMSQAAAGVREGKFQEQKVFLPGHDYSQHTNLVRYMPQNVVTHTLEPTNPAHRSGIFPGQEMQSINSESLPALNYYREGVRGEPQVTGAAGLRYVSQIPSYRLYDMSKAKPSDTAMKIADPRARERYLREQGYGGIMDEQGHVRAWEPTSVRSINRMRGGKPAEELSVPYPDLPSGKYSPSLQRTNQVDRSTLNELKAGPGAYAHMIAGGSYKDWKQAVLDRVPPALHQQMTEPVMRQLYSDSRAAMEKHLGGVEPQEYMNRLHGLAAKGMHGVGWYDKMTPMLEKWVGKQDAPMLREMIAATSPLSDAAASNEAGNIPRALKAYRLWKESKGDPDTFAAAIEHEDFGLADKAIKSQLKLAANNMTLTGQKIYPFSRNMAGSKNYLTNDTWMHRVFFPGAKVEGGWTPAQRDLAETVTRDMAQKYGLDVRDMQSVLWHGQQFVGGGVKEAEAFRHSFNRIATEKWEDIKHVLDIPEPPKHLGEAGIAHWKTVMTAAALGAGALAAGDKGRAYIHSKLKEIGLHVPDSIADRLAPPTFNMDEQRQLQQVEK